MFRLSDSEDDTPSAEEKDRLNRLAQTRREDLKATYDEEKDHYKGRMRTKKRHHDTLSDDSDDEEPDEDHRDEKVSEPPTKAKKMTIAESLMMKMGHKEGTGLGREGQGRVDPVALSTQRGRVGLGHDATKTVGRDFTTTWDESVEEKTIEEHVEWLGRCEDGLREEAAEECAKGTWMEIGKEKLTIDDEAEFCDQEILTKMLKAKDVFDMLSDRELRDARTRANPYETVGGAFFQNRAAMKTANLDKVFDWVFSGETNEESRLKKNPIKLENLPSNDVDRNSPIFYFADVCAGPGGFSEYMLWRKGFYNTKGFGFTLKGKDDFKLGKFTASSAHFFEPYYGKHGDGDVMNPENIDSLQDFIMKGTNGVGVDMMMADGGFSVEGKENIQEILSKRLYLCQLLVSLCIVKEGGNFFCKLFDIFTPFSAGLVYLMHVCYDEISLHKPHTSRPANSERYIICKGLRKEYSDRIACYMKSMNRKMDEFKKARSSDDVMGCVPIDIMKEDPFFSYLVRHNERMALRQTTYLDKYLKFAKNQGLIDKDQGQLREDCLKYWMVPNKQRGRNLDRQRQSINPWEMLGRYCKKLVGEDDLNVRVPLFSIEVISDPSEKQLKYAEYMCTRLGERVQPKLLVSTGDAVFIFASGRWNRNDNNEMRIPDKTILLVEETKSYVYDKSRLSDDLHVIRVVDAAVLHGDDVSGLSLENRLKAAAKFAKALRRVEPKMRIGWGNRESIITPKRLVVAEYFSFPDLIQKRPDFSVTRFKGNEVVTFEENGLVFLSQAIRPCRLLQADWKMGWSRSNGMEYAFQPKRESVFKKDFEAHQVCASFWDTAIMRKPKAGAKPDALMQCLWKWENSLEDNYGVRAILEDDHHRSGPTLRSILGVIEDTDRKAGKQ